jgi:hypothetical protein
VRPNRILRTGAMVLVSATLAVGAWGMLPTQRTAAAGPFYSKSSATNFSTLSNWGTNPDGSGTPPTVIDNTSDFIVANGAVITTLGGSVTVHNLTVQSGSSLTLDGTNTLTAGGTGGGAVAVAGSLTVAGSIVSQIVCVNLAVNNGGTVTNNSTLGSGQPIAVSGIFAIDNGGTYIHNTARSANIGATKSFGNASNFEYRNGGAFTVNLPYGNLRWNGTGSATANASSAWTVNGTLRISAGAFNLQSTNTAGVNVGGGFLVDGGTFNSSSGAGVGTITFVSGGVGSGDIQVAGGTANLQNLVINSGRIVGLLSSISIPSSRALLVSGTLYAGTSMVVGSGYFTLTNDATLGIGSPDGISSSGATGNIQVTGARSFTTTANYVYNGAAAQVTGNGLPSSVNSLVISNTAGVTLTNDGTISATLVLTGDLKTESNTLTMGSDATSSGEGDVVGSVKRTVTPGKSYSFGSPYVTIYFSSTGTISDVTVNLAKATPDDFTNAVTRTYTITPTGSGYTATLRLRYLDSELGENNANNLQLWRFNSADNRWSLQWRTGPVNTTEKWIEKAQVTEFSKWVMADKGSPTAVTLSSFSGDSGSFPALVLTQVGLSVLAGLAATTVGQLRRRPTR